MPLRLRNVVPKYPIAKKNTHTHTKKNTKKNHTHTKSKNVKASVPYALMYLVYGNF